MKIAINMLYMLPGVVGGTETYASGLLCGLANLKTEDTFIIFLNRESKNWPLPDAVNFTRVVCPVEAANRANRYFYEQALFQRLLKKHNVDIVHSLGYVGPLLLSRPHVVTIHDLNFIGHKENMVLAKRLILSFFVTNTARRADHIIATSNFTKQEISAHLNIPLNKITFVYEAIERGSGNANNIGWDEISSRHAIRKPYIIAFSSQSRHKNILRLIKSFEKIVLKFPHNLVLIGHIPLEMSMSNIFKNSNLSDRVFVTGYVPRDFIMPLLAHAELFVFPSFYEGFGLPIIEAQQSGVCVVAAEIAALPEVAGEGAAWFDPYSVDSMSKAIATCLQDVNVRKTLIQKGYKNINRFSWENAAKQTLDIYRNFALKK